MNQDMSAGLGAGLMNLGSMFSQMLMKRMDSTWEDEQYEKRLAAAQKAEMAKLKALDEYKATQTAGYSPFVQDGPDGTPQYMQQAVNPMGAPIGGPTVMDPHRRPAFEQQQAELARKRELDAFNLLGKKTDIEADRTRMLKDEAEIRYKDARAKGIGSPKEKEPKGKGGSNSTALNSTLKDARDLITQLEEPQLSLYKEALASEISSINSGLPDADDTITGLLLLMSKYTPGKQPVVK